jgi:hypothetical protein
VLEKLTSWLKFLVDINEDNNEISFQLYNGICLIKAYDIPNFGTHLEAGNILLVEHKITKDKVAELFLARLKEVLATDTLGLRRFDLDIKAEDTGFDIINKLDNESYHPNYLYKLKTENI